MMRKQQAAAYTDTACCVLYYTAIEPAEGDVEQHCLETAAAAAAGVYAEPTAEVVLTSSSAAYSPASAAAGAAAAAYKIKLGKAHQQVRH
jgi:hypothetical protein